MAKYEFNGDTYLKASGHQKEWGRKLIEELNIKDNDRILDLGCGDGLLTRMMKEKAHNGYVLGIDASEGMILKAGEYAIPNLEFKQMDINEIDFKELFTIIISNAALHWVKDHEKLMRNCFQALRENGILRFNFAGRGNCSHFFKVIKAKIKEKEYWHYFKEFEWPWYMPSGTDYEKTINGKGFSEFRIWEENADRYFGNEDEMIKWLDQPSLVPFLKYINDREVKVDFRNGVVNEMVKITKGDDGRCFETFRRINVFAGK